MGDAGDEREDSIAKAWGEATGARRKAYAPYSKFLVGACFKAASGREYFSGFNIENSSYPAGLCAERVALCHMFAELGDATVPQFLLVATDTDYALGPCGQCLQVLTEFCQPSMPVYLANLQGVQKKILLGELIRFAAEDFKKTLQGGGEP